MFIEDAVMIYASMNQSQPTQLRATVKDKDKKNRTDFKYL